MRGDEPYIDQGVFLRITIRPTCVGMNRLYEMELTRAAIHPPHMRGGEWRLFHASGPGQEHPPHMRGGEWHNLRNRRASIEIRPTCVGMNASGQGITAPTDDSLLS